MSQWVASLLVGSRGLRSAECAVVRSLASWKQGRRRWSCGELASWEQRLRQRGVVELGVRY